MSKIDERNLRTISRGKLEASIRLLVILTVRLSNHSTLDPICSKTSITVRASLIRGTLLITHGLVVNRVAAKIGVVAFLEPLTLISPFSFLPPFTMNFTFSIIWTDVN